MKINYFVMVITILYVGAAIQYLFIQNNPKLAGLFMCYGIANGILATL